MIIRNKLKNMGGKMDFKEIKKDLVNLRNYLDDIHMEDNVSYEKDRSINNALEYINSQQSKIEELEIENEYLKSCENCYPFLGSCFNCMRHENPRSKEKLVDNWTKK